MSPFELGYRVAAMEIVQGVASNTPARDRQLFVDDVTSRWEWDQGYETCVCAYRLGHEISYMVKSQLFEISTVEPYAVVQALLDNKWPHITRPDPRK
jgi:hypothetical protein